MPHILRSVSHASRNGAEIYVAEPRDRLLDLSVSQRDAESPFLRAYRARAKQRDAKLARQRLHRPDTLRCAGDDGSPVGLAEQYLVRGERCAVRGQVNVQTKSVLLIRTTHRDLSECNAESALRAVMRRPEQPALGAGFAQHEHDVALARAWLGTARSARVNSPIIPTTGVGSTAPVGLSL